MLHSLCGSSTAGQMAIKCSKDIRGGEGDLFVSLTKSPAVTGSQHVRKNEAMLCFSAVVRGKTSGRTTAAEK